MRRPGRRCGATARAVVPPPAPPPPTGSSSRRFSTGRRVIEPLPGRAHRRGRRFRRPQWEGALANGDRADGDIPPRAPGQGVRRRLARSHLRAERQDGSHRLVLPNRRPGQGRRGRARESRLRRLLRRAALRARFPLGSAAVAVVVAGSPRRARALLLNAGGRVRPRLHRLDGRQGVRLRCHDRRPTLVTVDGRLRLLVTGRLAEARLSSAPTPAASTPSTQPPARCAGALRQVGGSREPRP